MKSGVFTKLDQLVNNSVAQYFTSDGRQHERQWKMTWKCIGHVPLVLQLRFSSLVLSVLRTGSTSTCLAFEVKVSLTGILLR